MDDEVVVIGPKKKRAQRKPKKFYKCQSCSYTTNRAYNIQRHLPKHEAKPPKELQHLCPYSGCWFSSLRFDNMTRHIQGLHRTDKPLVKTSSKPQTTNGDIEILSTEEDQANKDDDDTTRSPETTYDDIERLSSDEDQANQDDDDTARSPGTTYDDIEILSSYEEPILAPTDDRKNQDDHDPACSEDVNPTCSEDEYIVRDEDLETSDDEITFDQQAESLLMSKGTQIEKDSKNQQLNIPNSQISPLARDEDLETRDEEISTAQGTSDNEITTTQPAENLMSKPIQIEEKSENQQQNIPKPKKSRRKHKTIIYKCNSCDFSTDRGFNIKRHLIKHMANFTKEVVYHVCIISGCKYATPRWDSLCRHVKLVHPGSSAPKPDR